MARPRTHVEALVVLDYELDTAPDRIAEKRAAREMNVIHRRLRRKAEEREARFRKMLRQASLAPQAA